MISLNIGTSIVMKLLMFFLDVISCYLFSLCFSLFVTSECLLCLCVSSVIGITAVMPAYNNNNNNNNKSKKKSNPIAGLGRP